MRDEGRDPGARERVSIPLSEAAQEARRLGVYGGSFDPPHAGHLHVAARAREAFELDHVLFVPAARPPHKPTRSLAPDADRIALLEMLLIGTPDASLWTGELEREGPSYTLLTLRSLRAQCRGALFLVVGSDNLPGFPTWYGVHDLLRLAQPVVVYRRGEELDVDGLAGLSEDERAILAQGFVEGEPFDASSTELRARLAAGEEPGPELPPKLSEYVRARGLYRSR